MFKYIALYQKPADPEAFEKQYFGSHVPLVEKTPACSGRRSPGCRGCTCPASSVRPSRT